MEWSSKPRGTAVHGVMHASIKKSILKCEEGTTRACVCFVGRCIGVIFHSHRFFYAQRDEEVKKRPRAMRGHFFIYDVLLVCSHINLALGIQYLHRFLLRNNRRDSIPTIRERRW